MECRSARRGHALCCGERLHGFQFAGRAANWKPSLTLGEFQWLTIKAVFPDIERPIGGVVHVPVQCDRVRMRCKQRGGEANWMCMRAATLST